jgi:hypothetical protein
MQHYGLKLAILHINVYSISHEKEEIRKWVERTGLEVASTRAGIMIYGPMVSAKSLFPDIMILMKNLLVPFYAKQRKEINHEIFWKNIQKWEVLVSGNTNS